jgi:hypothetical protein
MVLLGEPIKWFIKYRENKIRRILEKPLEIQNDLLFSLVSKAANTFYGNKYGFAGMLNADAFREQCPLNDYESLKGYINETIEGKQNILWPAPIMWFSKSSGTTSDKSKFIPVSREALNECHYKGGYDLLTSYIMNNPGSKIFSGKSLVMGGSQTIHPMNSNTRYGDISAVMISNMPKIGAMLREPELSIALMSEWESKLQQMAESTVNKRISSIAGVPTWTLVLIQKLFDLTGKNDLLKIWPHLELYVHGGVSFTPYEKTFRKLIGNREMRYLQTYNASEGFFGFQDRNDADDMLLAVDHGIFYEFIPVEEFTKENPTRLTLKDVQLNKNYVLIISSNAGLWAYNIGDTVKFVSLNPYRILVTGRVKHYISAFGEHVIAGEVEEALMKAAESENVRITEFTVAPNISTTDEKSFHEWYIEFENFPKDLDRFAKKIDHALRKKNIYYNDLIKGNILQPLKIRVLQKNAFINYMKSVGKLGGQNKVPRLSNDRKLVSALQRWVKQKAETLSE